MTKDRKQSLWNRQKIENLIELYRKQACLWNPWNEFYKHKEKRSKAIETICSFLNVSKPEFAKKIHNLRNQFNSELKKYEQLLEETDGLEQRDINEYRCRWAHFQSLLFLKDVIAPRPGIAQKEKRIRLESSANNSSNAQMISNDIYIEETNIGDDDDDAFDGFEENTSDNFQNLTTNNSKDEPRDIITLTETKASPTKYFTRLHPATAALQLKQLPQQEVRAARTSQALSAGAVIDLDASVEKRMPILSSTETKIELRDQWTAFGEFIANEFRNFHSDLSRRKLKRKIMQAMLEVGEEDEGKLSL